MCQGLPGQFGQGGGWLGGGGGGYETVPYGSMNIDLGRIFMLFCGLYIKRYLPEWTISVGGKERR